MIVDDLDLMRPVDPPNKTDAILIVDPDRVLVLPISAERVQRRVGDTSVRPLARDPQRFAALYESRREVYALADVRIVIESDDVEPAVEAVLNHPMLK